MSIFGEKLAKHIANELNVGEDEVAMALESFVSPITDDKPITKKKSTPITTSKPAIVEKKPSAPVKKGESAKITHKCERVKKGQTDKCGKNASRSISIDGKDHWFCGTEKGGCYSCEIKTVAKKEIESKIVPKSKNAPAKKTQPKAAANKNSEEKSKNLLQTVIHQKDIDVKKKKTPSGKVLWMDYNSRALVERPSNEFYGILSSDDETILPIDNKTARWIEGMNMIIKQSPETKPQVSHRSRGVEEKTKKSTSKKVVETALVESVESEEEEDVEESELDIDEELELELEDDGSDLEDEEDGLEIDKEVEEDELEEDELEEDELEDSELEDSELEDDEDV